MGLLVYIQSNAQMRSNGGFIKYHISTCELIPCELDRASNNDKMKKNGCFRACACLQIFHMFPGE